ncbi:uncharacterized protein LOC105186868 isoform X2 [Harpegnathos saltator]|uniref:uncharacterized protein LOC105186868 isoform X2 n=1 Tax=Harpegnathos saltator TaxID=610380 RepID=UPI00058D87C8|nr:uncharacterized protein LOC105186868 isoform X2 [Harpegnathos saltator]
MKGTILLLFTIIAVTMSEDYVGRLMNIAKLKREKVLECMNKTHVTIEDFEHFDRVLIDKLVVDFDNVVLKVGCLFSCIFQEKEVMTGAHIDIDKIKDMLRSKFRRDDTKQLDVRLQLLDTCSNEEEDSRMKTLVIIVGILTITMIYDYDTDQT